MADRSPLEAAELACRQMGIDLEDAPVIEAMMGRHESTWAPCCGSDCRPCMLDYHAAARRAAELLKADG